jgi:DnaK suppressor protein
MNDDTKINASVYKARLETRRDELLRLAAASAGDRRPVELDQTRVGRLSRMDALQSQAMSIETDRRRRAELGRIEAALGRIVEGEFGYCLSCGEAIAPKRLELNPANPLCVDCAQS